MTDAAGKSKAGTAGGAGRRSRAKARNRMRPTKREPLFSKEQLLASRHFSPSQKDALRALLADGERLTLPEARRRLQQWMGKEIR
jgi:hypothetical protein